jgi:hypothetical protein
MSSHLADIFILSRDTSQQSQAAAADVFSLCHDYRCLSLTHFILAALTQHKAFLRYNYTHTQLIFVGLLINQQICAARGEWITVEASAVNGLVVISASRNCKADSVKVKVEGTPLTTMTMMSDENCCGFLRNLLSLAPHSTQDLIDMSALLNACITETLKFA